MPSLPPGHLKLAQRLRGKLVTAPAPARPFWAKVTVVTTGPPKTVTVQQGSLTPVAGLRYLASYTPTVGDNVFGWAIGNDYLIVGKLA